MLNTNNNDFNNLIYFFTVFNGIKDIKLQEQLLDWPINNIENKADIQDIIEEKTATLCEEYKDKLSDEQIVCFLSAIKYYHSLDFKERKTINEYIYMKRYETKARNSQENNVIKFPSEK